MTAPGHESPIFIGGLSYSGKTPLRMVLGAHPELSLTRKSYLWERFYGRFGDLEAPANLDRCLTAISRDAAAARLRPDRERLVRDLGAADPTYARLLGLLHQHHAERVGKRRWGDQIASIERFADPIFAAYPSARIIHMIRDPRDRTAARTRGGRPRSGKLGWDVAMWMHSVELALRNRARYPDGYRVVRCETFMADPRGTVAELCGFLEEDVVPAVDAAVRRHLLHGGGEPAKVPARGSQEWSGRQATFVDRYTAREQEVFGYRPASPRLSATERVALVLADWPLNRAGMAAWRVLRNRPLEKRVGC